MSSTEKSILVLGGPKSGKTHYGAQLTIRLRKQIGALKFYAPPENLEAFEEPMQQLNRGRLAVHTPVTVSKDVVMPMELADGRRSRVIWPDYGGEQVQRMFGSRITPAAWRDRARTASGWLLMVRPVLFRTSRDLLHRPLKDFVPRAPEDTTPLEWSPEAQVIELLQSLLYARRSSRETVLAVPRLVVGITCWDETVPASDPRKPMDELRQLTPMLANYLAGNWRPDAVDVVGLSSLGKTLRPDADDDEFIDQGPHRQGFVVLPDGTRSPDLTWPLIKLLG